MKPIMLVTLLLGIGLCATFALSRNNKNQQSIAVRLNIKDLKEYGVGIIGPSDPSYNSMVGALSSVNSNTVIQALRPYYGRKNSRRTP